MNLKFFVLCMFELNKFLAFFFLTSQVPSQVFLSCRGAFRSAEIERQEEFVVKY